MSLPRVEDLIWKIGLVNSQPAIWPDVKTLKVESTE